MVSLRLRGGGGLHESGNGVVTTAVVERTWLWSSARWLWVTDVDINKEVVGFGGSCGT